MTMDQTSLPQLKHDDQQPAAFFQYQEDIKKIEENLIVQIVMHARKEWEAFHLQHPDVDEETFCEAQRFCLKQWVLQSGLLLSNFPAFKRAKMHFDYEVQERTAEIQAITLMMGAPMYQQARSLGTRIAAQAHQRSKQVREAIGNLSSKNGSYLVGKVNKLRAPGQALERVKEAEEHMKILRQGIEYIKSLGIAIAYENQKKKLEEREKEILEHLDFIDHIMQDSKILAEETADVTKFEAQLGDFGTVIEALHLKTFAIYDVQDAPGTMPINWDIVTKQAEYAHGQLEVFAGFIGSIQRAIITARAKAEAEIAQVKCIHQHVQKVNHALERLHKRSAKREQWVVREMNKVEKRIKNQGKLKELNSEEQTQQAIEIARNMTKKTLEIFANICVALTEIESFKINIAKKEENVAKSFEKVKDALKRAIRAAEHYAKDAKHASDQQARVRALPDRGAEATHAEEQARRTVQEEQAAYSQAKTAFGYARRYSRAIASEHRKVQETAKIVAEHFTTLLQSYLPSEKDVLDRAITGVKTIVKAAMNVLKLERKAQEAAHQTAAVLKTAESGSLARVIASEQEALLLVALANDSLVQCATSYRIFQKLAAEVAKEYLSTMKQQWQGCLEVINTYLDEIKPEKDEQILQRQRAASAKSQSKAHLLIDEQTGAISLKDGVAAFSLQDLAGIGEVPPQENPGQSRLLFKDRHVWSNYDVAHDLLHERSEGRTMIHLQVPDGMGGYMPILYLPNGTQIQVADIDLSETEYDPARPERGVTITLKKDGGKINLLAAASVMTELTQEALQELVYKSLDESINRIRHAVRMKSMEAIQDAFEDAKIDDRNRKYLDTYILSSKIAEKRAKDHIEWMESVVSAAEQIIYTLRKYGNDALQDEIGSKEITDVVLLEHLLLDNMHNELYQKRDACLQKIARGKGLDRIINCQIFADPNDDSIGTNLSPNILEVLVEYDRAKAWQLAEQGQNPAACGPSEKWTRYLRGLRRTILDEAPAYFRTRFLIYEIREAVETDHWEDRTPEDPGVTSLAKELSAVDGQGSGGGGDNDYARAIEVLTQRVVVGIQKAVKVADPCEIMARASILDFVFSVIEYAEARIEDALDPTTPTMGARLVVDEIGNGSGAGSKEHGMSERVRRQS